MAPARKDSRFENVRIVTADVLSVIGGVISVLVAISALLWLAFRPTVSQHAVILADAARKHQAALENVVVALTDLNKRVEAIEANTRVSSSVATVPNRAVEVEILRNNIKHLNNRLTGIEQTIMSTPERVLSVPMLTREIESTKKDCNRGVQALATEIERLYEFNKWFVALVVGMALTTMGSIFRALSGKDKEAT